jgi:V/A-type H+-transporting ATPase subunit K
MLSRFLKYQIVILLGLIVISFLTAAALGVPLDINSFTQLGVGDYVNIAIGAGLAIGLAGLGAGICMGTASSAIIGAITEKPEMFGKTLIFVVLIEAIAIYGLVISFLLLQQLP